MKNENLHALLAEAKAHRDGVLAKCAPLEKARNAAFEKAAAAEAERRTIGDKIAALKDAKFREACNQVAALTKALGGAHSLSAESGSYGVEGKPIGG